MTWRASSKKGWICTRKRVLVEIAFVLKYMHSMCNCHGSALYSGMHELMERNRFCFDNEGEEF